MFRYSPVESTFNSAEETAANACYCSAPQSCPPSGIFDLSNGCKVTS